MSNPIIAVISNSLSGSAVSRLKNTLIEEEILQLVACILWLRHMPEQK
jgi:hypothetical protein